MMLRNNMVVSLSKNIPPHVVCTICVFGNHHKEDFDSWKAWWKHDWLELVHSDICCMRKPWLEGGGYILTLLDNFFKFTWVYFFERFKEFRELVAKQCGRPIKFLISNNGG